MRRLAAAVVILFAGVPLAAQSPAADQGARLFVDKCSACHSVGGGDGAGPDLIHASRLSSADLHAALKRMQDNVGPLTGDEVESAIAFLKSQNVKQLVAAAEQPQPVPKAAEIERGSPETGRRLFFGNERLKNGGTPCFACHAVSGRGGALAVDLTVVRSRIGQSALVAVAQQPVFPLMKAAYSKRPVTEEEAYHVAAFLKESGGQATPGPQARESTNAVDGVAAGFALIVLAGVGLILRTRRAGVRSRMVRNTNSPKGE